MWLCDSRLHLQITHAEYCLNLTWSHMPQQKERLYNEALDIATNVTAFVGPFIDRKLVSSVK